MPSARLRSWRPGNVVVSVEIAAGAANATPSPWRARDTTSAPAPGASEAGAGRTQGEQREAGEQGALSPEDVGDAAAEQDRAAESDRIGGDHPLHVARGEAEVVLDRGRDHHERLVEPDDELHEAEHRQHLPGAPRILQKSVLVDHEPTVEAGSSSGRPACR